MKYGDLPQKVGYFPLVVNEMFFYQYLPIKMPGSTDINLEDRLKVIEPLVGASCCDFIADYGLKRFFDSHVYLTAKNMYQTNGCSFNRPGFHSDGFMTDDINYIWSNSQPTIFNYSDFNLTMGDTISLKEMEEQAIEDKNVEYNDNVLLRLNQYNIHKVSDQPFEGMRCFVKVSISKDRYDLLGNSKNHLIDYDWQMKPRKQERNIPQSNIL